MIKDVFILRHAIVKGTVPQCQYRLSDYLRQTRKSSFEVRDADAFLLFDGSRTEHDLVRLQKHAIVLAHELVSLAGDSLLAGMERGRSRREVDLVFGSGPVRRLRGRAFEDIFKGDSPFSVVIREGIHFDPALARPVAKELAGLDYFIVNRENVDAILFAGDGASDRPSEKPR